MKNQFPERDRERIIPVLFPTPAGCTIERYTIDFTSALRPGELPGTDLGDGSEGLWSGSWSLEFSNHSAAGGRQIL
jgi:hypothetical protein